MKTYYYPSQFRDIYDNTRDSDSWCTSNEDAIIVTTNSEIKVCMENNLMTFTNDSGFTVNRILMLLPYAFMEFAKTDKAIRLKDGFCLVGFKFDENTSTAYILFEYQN